MLVGEAGLEDHLVAPAVARLQRLRLVEGQADLAGDHVDGAGKQVRLQRRGVFDGADDDALECRRRALPVGIADQHDVRAGRHLGDAVGAVVEAGVGRIGGVAGARRVGVGLGEGGGLDVLGQQLEVVDGVVVEVAAVEVQDEGALVLDVDLRKAAPELLRHHA